MTGASSGCTSAVPRCGRPCAESAGSSRRSSHTVTRPLSPALRAGGTPASPKCSADLSVSGDLAGEPGEGSIQQLLEDVGLEVVEVVAHLLTAIRLASTSDAQGAEFGRQRRCESRGPWRGAHHLRQAVAVSAIDAPDAVGVAMVTFVAAHIPERADDEP